LAEKTIDYSLSTDGRTWHTLASVARTGDYAARPALLIVGRGGDGPGEVLQNDERWSTSPVTAWIGDLLVGRDP
jgi:hypothetical protein